MGAPRWDDNDDGVIENEAVRNGGGILSLGTATIVRTLFSNNHADADGGALYLPNR